MPINPIVLQRRHAELGRIRLGEKGSKGQPQKLTTFRFTSPNAELVAQIAALYGGTAKAWDNQGKAEHEVVTDAKSIDVIVVKGGFSQWMETWTGGGCAHRCDGVTNQMTQEPCDPNDPSHVEAKPYTRLSVMLRDVESLGVWRMESHGWNAAAELPSMAELAEYVGDLVPAVLHLVQRTSKIKVNGRVQTAQYVVPVLDLAISKRRLVELVGGCGGTPAIDGHSPAAIEAARATDWAGLVDDATTTDELKDIWRQAGEAGHLSDDLQARITARASEIAGPVKESNEEIGATEALTATGDKERAWVELVMEAGRHDVSDTQLRQMLEEQTAQPFEDVTAEQLQAALVALQGHTAEATA